MEPNAAVDVVWTVTVAIVGALAGFLVTWYKKSYKTAMSGWGGALAHAKEALQAGAGYRDAYHALLMKTYGDAWTTALPRDSKTKTDD